MKRPVRKRTRIILNLLTIFLSTALIYKSLGCPILFPQLRMQLAEKENLVGPSVIIDELDKNEYDEFRKLIVGETEHGYVFYAIADWNSDYLFYRKKAGDMTLLAAPTSLGNWHTQTQEKTLPIYLFHEYPTAVRAELDLTIIGDQSDPHYYLDSFTRTYSLQADQGNSEFFLFFIHVPAADTELGIDGLAPQLFSDICHSSNSYVSKQTAYAAIRLYGSNDELLAETELTVCSNLAELLGT